MRRHQSGVDEPGSPLPLRATGIFFSIWITGLVVLAIVVVPAIFATCTGAPVNAPGP